MKKTFWHHIFLLVVITSCPCRVYGVPAPRQMLTVTQPDGTKLDLKLIGDEFFHYALSSDGYVLVSDGNGFYNYGVQDSTGSIKASSRIARNADKRTDTDRAFLKTIKPGLIFSERQIGAAIKNRTQRVSTSISASRSAKASITGLINNYPTVGSPKSLVILVNFSDVSFKSSNTATLYSNMLNQEGYDDGRQIGSASDYFKFNSGGVFSPDFVVVGPVTMNQNMAYYGQNSNDEDVHPAKMVFDACLKASSSVDFSDFDYDNDGYVDNIYVIYAGKGEADGGGVNTIWPHSWALSGESLSLNLNGKSIDAYACSSELTGTGARCGIGTFSHEYSHILGLPDFYDTDYSVNGQSYDIEDWSLMAYGSYNGDGCIPPCLSILERKLLGWSNPTELINSTSISMSDFGSGNQGYIIKTNDSAEYYLLENRQQTVNHWDSALPYHGLLVYHVDMRTITNIYVSSLSTYCSPAYLWNHNMVNAISSHQCADIEEADYTQSLISIEGDPFPGLKNTDSFTDSTIPSMKTWNGTELNMPITSITENGKIILFDIKIGNHFTEPPSSLQAIEVKPFQFKVKWASAQKAKGYYLDVYTQEISSGDTVKNYVSGYKNFYLKDTASVVYVPNDLTNYYYCVRATNNYATTLNSNVASVLTTDGTPLALPATDVSSFKFTANWKVEDWAVGCYLDVYKSETTANGDTIYSYLDGYNNKSLTDTTITINELDDQTSYYYRIRSSTGYADTRNSNIITLTTPKSSTIVPYIKDKTVYLKGIDHESIVMIYNMLGKLCKTSNNNQFTLDQSGIYLIEAYLDGKKNMIKVLVQ